MRLKRICFCAGLLCVLVWLGIALLYYQLYNHDRNQQSRLYIESLRAIDESLRDHELVDLVQLAIIRSPEEQKLRESGYKNHGFNLLISDRLGVRRNIPDVRPKVCSDRSYDAVQSHQNKEAVSASVVICFHNEAWSVLLRTVHSVVERSTAALLHEIILVDDFSNLSHLLGSKLQNYLTQNVPKAKLVHTQRREGLIRARIFGADQATGKILIFMDSHCEVNAGWLEPLLELTSQNRRNVAVPVIDVINQDTFEYTASPLVRGGFNWGLFYRWDEIPDSLLSAYRDQAKPIPTPAMAGGLFAIDRLYFYEMGRYDAGMDVWGGENLELSFRIWMCGGRIDIVPCSRVGHVFRSRRPYSSPGGDSMTRNALRLAHVWLDEFKEYYFHTRPDARSLDYGDIRERRELRQRLGCKSFSWYLENIYPQQTLLDLIPGGNFMQHSLHDKSIADAGMMRVGSKKNKNKSKVEESRFYWAKSPTIRRKGQLRHIASQLCVVSDGDIYEKRALLRLNKCVDRQDLDKAPHQIWYDLKGSYLQLSGQLCIDYEEVTQGRSYPRLMKCHYEKGGGTQQWTWLNHKQLLNPASGKCLSISHSPDGSSSRSGALANSVHTAEIIYLSVELCNESRSESMFEFLTDS